MIVGYDPSIVMGAIMWMVPSDHPMAGRCAGEPLITVARGIGREWERLVVVKEMMHYFDDPLSHVGSASQFEQLINEFVNERPNDTEAMISENVAYWRALALFCNEQRRQELGRLREAGRTSDIEIAAELLLPIECVPHLFDPRFPEVVADLLRC